MAKGKKTGGRNFKKGQSGNPNGRPPVPEDVKEARKLGKNEFTRIMNRCLFMTLAEFDEELRRPDITMFEKSCMQMVAHASAGCERRFEMILNRFLGRPRDKMELTLPQPFVIKTLDGSKAMELGAKVREES